MRHRTLLHRAKLVYLSILIVVGCSSSNPEPDLSAILDKTDRREGADVEDISEFDFGAVVARGQTLRHEFTLTNRFGRPVRLLDAKTNVPCCSSVGNLPGSISAGGSNTIPVFLKVGQIAERKRVSFEVAMEGQPTRTLVLTARFLPECEVEESSGESGPSRVGQDSKRHFKAVCRRKGGEGRTSPSDIVAQPPLRIEQLGPGNEIEWSDGLIEATREFDLVLIGQPKPGPQLGMITLGWPDGLTKTHEIRWEVNSGLQINPLSLVLRHSATITKSTVTIRSDHSPFRVVKVDGAILAEGPRLPERSALTQQVELRIDSARVNPGERSTITIDTDHPDQKSLVLDILILPREKEIME